MDSFEKFNQTELPNKDQFYSILNDQHITDDDYDHGNKVWNTFMIKTMGEYHDLYLVSVSNMLLLTDVFENFRKTCMQYYKLDPCHYFTSPGLSWDAMLKMTNIKLELMTDIDMFQFIEKGMRGGVSYIANRYGNATNKYMKEYDQKAPSKYIMYLDANNLYGWAMSQYLPTGNFKWMTDKQISKIDLGKYKADGKKGLIPEVDLEYPQELHDIIMTILSLLKRLRYQTICSQPTARRLLKNITSQLDWLANLFQHEETRKSMCCTIVTSSCT